MAKMTSNELAEEGKKLNDLIVKARKKPLNFALLLGKDRIVLEASPLKGADIMRRQAKANGGGSKGTQGTMSVSGKVIELTCVDEDFPRSLAKTAKKHLKDCGIAMKFAMLLPGGGVIGDDGPDGEVQARPTGNGADPEPQAQTSDAQAPDKAALIARLKTASARIKDIARSDPDLGARLAKAAKASATDIANGDLERAEKLIVVIESPEPKSTSTSSTTTTSGAVTGARSKPVADSGTATVPKTDEASASTSPPPPTTDSQRDELKLAFAALSDNYQSVTTKAPAKTAKKATQLSDLFAKEIAGDHMAKARLILGKLKAYLDAEVAKLPEPTLFEKAATAEPDPAAKAKRYDNATPIETKYPKGAAAAKGALDSFAGTLGDIEVTPEILQKAKDEIAALEKRVTTAEQHLKDAKAMTDGPEKIEAIKLAQARARTANEDLGKGKAFEKAARGKDGLLKALSGGPLSKNSKQTLSDEAAEAIINGFTRDPDLATTALSATETAKYPGAVAKGLTQVIDARETGFAAKNGDKFANDATSAKYGEDLLKMGANVGPEFFSRMPDYLSSGRQHVADPFGDLAVSVRVPAKPGEPAHRTEARKNLAKKTKRAQKRSVAIGAKLTDGNGNIDVTSKGAKDAVGDLLFNPSSLRNPTPAMNEHVVKTVTFLGEGDNSAKASGILKSMPKDTTSTTRRLVRKSMNKGGSASVNQNDTQTAVMAAMLKPLDQGPVGSCFSTAPARRMRETQPLDAMQAFADIAGTGKYEPGFGPEVNAVTRIPPYEDPIQRSWEYSLATSTARTAGAVEKDNFQKAMNKGAKDLSKKLKSIAKGVKKGDGAQKDTLNANSNFAPRALKKEIASSFEMIYDPNSTIVNSSDGKSTTGRYILVRKGTTDEIRNRASFVEQISLVAIAAVGLDSTSAEANEVRAFVGTDEFVKSVTPVEGHDKDGNEERYEPWAIDAGGFTDAATKTLFGSQMKEKKIIKGGDPEDDEAERTEKLLSDLINSFGDTPDEMITVNTYGMHGFNALPNDPSLDKLKGKNKRERAANLDTHLVKAGDAISKTKMPVEQVVHLFERSVADAANSLSNASVSAKIIKSAKSHLPTTEMTPKEMDKAIADFMKVAAHDPAMSFTNPDGAEKLLAGRSKGIATNLMIKELGAPEFTIADSNWGNSENHTFFVIAPNPISGEAEMWNKKVPPGTLTPTDREWVDVEWTQMK